MLLRSSFIYVSTYMYQVWCDKLDKFNFKYSIVHEKCKRKKKITQFPNRPPPTSPLFPLALFDSNAGILSENQREYVLRYFRE